MVHRRSAPGKGPAAGQGDKLTLRFIVYQDASFEREAAGAMQGQTVEFKPGAGGAWKWLEVAVAGMAVGEKRQVKLPVKVAEGAREWVRGEKLAETVYLEMELTSLEHSNRSTLDK